MPSWFSVGLVILEMPDGKEVLMPTTFGTRQLIGAAVFLLSLILILLFIAALPVPIWVPLILIAMAGLGLIFP